MSDALNSITVFLLYFIVYVIDEVYAVLLRAHEKCMSQDVCSDVITYVIIIGEGVDLTQNINTSCA